MSHSTNKFSSDHSTIKTTRSNPAIITITIYANESFGYENLGYDQTNCNSDLSRAKLPQRFPLLEERRIKLQLDDLTRDWEEQSHGLLYHSARRKGHNRQQGAGCFIESNIEGDMVRGVAYQNSTHCKDPDQRKVQLRAETA